MFNIVLSPHIVAICQPERMPNHKMKHNSLKSDQSIWIHATNLIAIPSVDRKLAYWFDVAIITIVVALLHEVDCSMRCGVEAKQPVCRR